MTEDNISTLGLGAPDDFLLLKEYSFELDVKKRNVPGKLDESMRGMSMNTVSVELSGNCSDCGIYVKITDPNGKVILDKSTPEAGFLKVNQTSSFVIRDPVSGEFLEPVIGKHTIWLKPTAPNVINGVGIDIGGFPKQ